MIVAIEGHRFDTAKATQHWRLEWFDDQSNRHTGDLYLSSKGTWYIETPSQWANGHRWELIDPEDVLGRYSKYLEQDELDEIIKLANLETE